MTYDKRGAGQPDNQGLLSRRVGAMKSFKLRLMSAYCVPDGWRAMLVNSMAKRGLERVVRNGASSLSRNTVGPC